MLSMGMQRLNSIREADESWVGEGGGPMAIRGSLVGHTDVRKVGKIERNMQGSSWCEGHNLAVLIRASDRCFGLPGQAQKPLVNVEEVTLRIHPKNNNHLSPTSPHLLHRHCLRGISGY
eukprot:760282-Hanusia_phi.AAC.1